MSKHSISWLKRKAKKLLVNYNFGTPEAIARVKSKIHDTNRITLMRCQHVIAVEEGFTNWSKLLEWHGKAE